MPLVRAALTRASRVMLPTYCVFFAWVGINYLLTPLHRLRETPGLRYLDDALDLRAVGLVLCAAALLMLIALVSEIRDLCTFTLLLAFGCFFCLLVAFLAASIFGHASPSAGAWPFLGTAATFASYRSVTAHEAN